MKIELINSNYQLAWRERFDNIYDFYKLLNWTSGEFILYQQEQKSGLKVFFPNGYFFITIIEEMTVEYEIIIKSKCHNTIGDINTKLISVINHLKNFKEII